MIDDDHEVPDLLLTTLREVFPLAPVPIAVVEDPHHCDGCGRLNAALLGRRWRDVTPHDLEANASNNALLTPEAFTYYLPAYLQQGITHPVKAGVGLTNAIDFLVQSLADPDLPDDAWWRERVELLTPAQRAAIASYLEWVVALIGDDEDEASIAAMARKGLSSFWRSNESQ